MHLIEGTRVCRTCKDEKPLAQYMVRADREGYVYPHCRDCFNKRRRALNAGRARPAEEKWLKKLPPYSVLRSLYLQQGLTVSEIAAKYDASRTSVWRKLEYWAKRVGDPWPLPLPDRYERNSRAQRRRSVRSDIIIDLVYAHVAEHPIFVVDSSGECSPRRQTLKEWCRRVGVRDTHVTKLRSTRLRISKPFAVKLLSALGEEPNPDLLEENYRIDKKYSGNYHRQGTGRLLNSLGGVR